VEFTKTYEHPTKVLAGLRAAHYVCDAASEALSSSAAAAGSEVPQAGTSAAAAWEVLRNQQALLDQGLLYTGWPKDGFNTLEDYTAQAMQQDGTLAAADMIAALRDALRLPLQLWRKLGHIESLPLPTHLPDGQPCSLGAALLLLQQQHTWVSVANPEGHAVNDPSQWQGNR
jgi:hypothetical protein